jgi:hypothetical protein
MKHLFVLLLSFLLTTSHAQSFGLDIGLEWSPYQRYQRPTTHQFSTISNGKNSAGQVLNIIPNLRLGVILTEFDIWGIAFHTGLTYSPFSLDIDQYKGMGAIAIPLTLSYQFYFDDNTFLSLGAGVQFSTIEMSARPPEFKNIPNPFFMTYVGEISIGGFSSYYIAMGVTGFARIGFNQHKAHTLDVGLRVNLLWI